MSAVPQVRRVAMLSVHTSPLEQPGTGDAGGLNVYVVEVSKRLAQRGIEVEIFTRMTDGALPLQSEIAPGVHVRNVIAGPFEGLGKGDLPGQLCAFAQGVMRAEAARPEGWYDLVHSHYWLSGQVGWLAADRWRVPLVHTMHTMARVKNSRLAEGDTPEPPGREIGEAQVVDAADRLVANTLGEAGELVDLYDADPGKVRVVSPGVDLELFTVGDVAAARAQVGLPQNAHVLLFVGRIQPLKAPDVLLKAAADLLARRPELRRRLVVAVVGGPSGSGLGKPRALQELAHRLGIQAQVRFVPPVDRATLALWYRAADLVTVPSYSESFGLVAVEAQACGTPVVAAAVGGLPFAIGDGGLLINGHRTADWSAGLEGLLDAPRRRDLLSRKAVEHAAQFSWERTTDQLLDVYTESMIAQASLPIAGSSATSSPVDAGGLVGVPAAVIP
ncbi:MAG TPA: D-inositol-3-phosphate glycosyltransferase [Dermatophilaceae bacterium]|nr:D-inositol-3-phosphate glycosyltransferase [Dermatophilaceae bacterium]